MHPVKLADEFDNGDTHVNTEDLVRVRTKAAVGNDPEHGEVLVGNEGAGPNETKGTGLLTVMPTESFLGMVRYA